MGSPVEMGQFNHGSWSNGIVEYWKNGMIEYWKTLGQVVCCELNPLWISIKMILRASYAIFFSMPHTKFSLVMLFIEIINTVC
jgi:hypothetical protein